MRSLLERKLVKLAGRRELPGRPMLYATSKRFLEVFGLADLDDLPTLREFEELEPEPAVANSAEEADGQGDASVEPDAAPDVAISLEDVEIEGKPN
jgi:segregation and condensation protein B